MENISNEDMNNKIFFKSYKKEKKSKKTNSFKKVLDSIINSSENSSIKTNAKNSEAKFNRFSSFSPNILYRYSGFSPKYNLKMTFGNNTFNSKKSIKNNLNTPIPNVKYTPQFKQSKKIECITVKKCDTPNEKNKTKKCDKHRQKKTFDSLHKQIKSEYKEILKKQIEKSIKINNVSRKFKIANDYNEINSKKFLYEKVKCLKKMNLSDQIDDEEENNDNVELTLSPINYDGNTDQFFKDIKKKNEKQMINIKNLNESDKYLTNFLFSVK